MILTIQMKKKMYLKVTLKDKIYYMMKQLEVRFHYLLQLHSKQIITKSSSSSSINSLQRLGKMMTEYNRIIMILQDIRDIIKESNMMIKSILMKIVVIKGSIMKNTMRARNQKNVKIQRKKRRNLTIIKYLRIKMMCLYNPQQVLRREKRN